MFTCLEPRPGPSTSGGELVLNMPATIEEIQGVVAGLSEVVKGLVGAIQAVHTAQSTGSQATPPGNPAVPSTGIASLRLPTLQLPTFRQDTKVQDDIADFLDRFHEQTAQFPVTVRLSLLEQQCIGEWPRSVLSFCHGTKGFAEKTPEEHLDFFVTSLRKEFQEPADSKCRCLASELSAMKQDPSESVDEFAFKYKNILHKLDKLGESLNKSCPTYVTLQFISKLQLHIACPLVLQAHNVAQLEKAIEAARRIEHSIITSESPTPSHEDSSSTSTVSHEIPQHTALVSSTSEQFRGNNRSSQEQRSCWLCGHTQHSARECPRRPPKKNKKPPEICHNFNRLLSANCKQANNKCSAGQLHKCFQCHKWGCKALRHKNVPPQSLIAGIPPSSEPSDVELLPTTQQQTVFGLPAVTNPGGTLKERHILWTPVVSAGEKLPLPLDSCCSVSLVSRSHADLVASKRPQLKYQSLEKPVAVSVADAKAQLQAVGTMEIPIQWNNGTETIFQMLVVPGLSWPILFGENHLHSTQALVDHADPSIHFRHPSMSFKITCSLQNPLPEVSHRGNNTHAGVTCLLTGAPVPGHLPGPSKLNRGLNFVSVYLTLGTSLLSLSHSDLWVHGQEIQPGVRVLSGPFHMKAATDHLLPDISCHASVCDLTSSSSDTISEHVISGFQSLYTTTLAVECKRKQTDIPQNVILGHLQPIQDEDLHDYEDAVENTANILSEAGCAGRMDRQPYHLLLYHILQQHPYLQAKHTRYQSNKKNCLQRDLTPQFFLPSLRTCQNLMNMTMNLFPLQPHHWSLSQRNIIKPLSKHWHLILQSMHMWIRAFFMSLNYFCPSIPQPFYFLALPWVRYMALNITLKLKMLYQSRSIPTAKVQKSFLLSRTKYSACSR